MIGWVGEIYRKSGEPENIRINEHEVGWMDITVLI